MFSKKIRQIRSTTAFRLAAWYSSVFIVSGVSLFLLAFHMLSNMVEEQDRKQITLKLTEYVITAKEEGIGDLLEEIKREKKDYRSAGFFVRVTDPQNHTLLCSLPRRFKDLDCSKLSSLPHHKSRGAIMVKRQEDEDVLEIMQAGLPRGYFLQVGKSSTEREDLIERFNNIFLAMLVLVTIVGLASGTFMAFKALSPLRDLIQTVQKIRAGSLDARVRVNSGREHSNDELDVLARLFNEMLEKIDALVMGMREALDYVAHDLRTPVTRLRAIAESTLQKSSDRDDLESALMDCAEEAERISVILSSLMELSEAEAGVMHLKMKKQALSPIVWDAVELYEYVAEEKGISIKVNIPKNLELYLDENRFRQTTANLVDNAIKYGKRDGRLEIKAKKEKDHVVISFADDGIGIPDAEIPRIFDRLYRGDKSRSQKGLGLGLCLVRAVVEAHGGSVKVESIQGTGTTIKIIFPLHQAGHHPGQTSRTGQ